jgi:DNA-binding NarL/FixJ family response regulator
MSEKIKVVIVDDFDIFRTGVRIVFETRHPDIEVVGEAGSGAEFFALLPKVSADIALLDIDMPGMRGTEVARHLKKEHPEMKILAISAMHTPDDVVEMVDIGIEGFISKSQGGGNIPAEAIRSIMQGYEYFGKDISDIIRRIYVDIKKTKQITSEFTEVETRIIEFCMEGLPAKLIADRLGNTARTVDWHKSNIFKKLGINSTGEMVRHALKAGIIRTE